MNTEFWVVCEDFPNYSVSNLGRVKTIKSINNQHIGHIKSQKSDKDGYKCVRLDRPDGVRTTARVHRLVAKAFIPNYNNMPVVHHKDKIKFNNDASNLEWVDVSYNTKHAYFTKSLRSPCAKYVKASIDGEIFSYYESAYQCSIYFGVSRNLVEDSINLGDLFYGLVTLEEVNEIPPKSTINKKLFTKDVDLRNNPHEILYKDGSKETYESPKEFAEKIGKSVSSAQRILFYGGSRTKYGIVDVNPLSRAEYYRPFLNVNEKVQRL